VLITNEKDVDEIRRHFMNQNERPMHGTLSYAEVAVATFLSSTC
jgi:hypothetical protein